MPPIHFLFFFRTKISEGCEFMRIAIPSETDSGLESFVSEHFGRSPYYVLIDIEENKIANVKVVENPFEEHAPGLVPKFLKEMNVDVVIAMGMGPRAQMWFNQFRIQVITGAKGKIKEVIEAYLRGDLKSVPYTPKRKFHEH